MSGGVLSLAKLSSKTTGYSSRTALQRHAHGARAGSTEAEHEPIETLVFVLEKRLLCAACIGEHLGRSLQPGETKLQDNGPSGASGGLPEFNQAALSRLEAMGFPLVRCQKALLATGNSDAGAAMEWLFGHMEDPDIDDSIVVPSGGSGGGAESSAEQVGMLADMGFLRRIVL
ncbi:UBA-like protein [Lactarius indigo]|nr:UBA-like protein [Lactarius indigo]